MSEKPLFIPLKTEFYEQFENGTKTDELREYGKRWNEKTCRVGRAVTISKGYGKQNRLYGVVSSFSRYHGSWFNSPHKEAIKKCYGTLDIKIAVISIRLRKVEQ